ncbi:MAG: AbrB/MazE/SpoVT family DNA-binding domain-containing protein [Rhodospirillales bacterium]|nr:AbrB/MazE/SpoVT family DNA-binding domain-containing protein [Rhodospirillales bacterium]
MTAQRARLAEGGRLVIPAEFRRELSLVPGESVVLDIRDGELRVRSLRRAVERAQALVRPYLPEAGSLSEDLARDRRAEAARE